MYLEVHEALTNFVVRLKARNGQIIMVTETYPNRSNAMRIARKLAKAFNLKIKES